MAPQQINLSDEARAKLYELGFDLTILLQDILKHPDLVRKINSFLKSAITTDRLTDPNTGDIIRENIFTGAFRLPKDDEVNHYNEKENTIVLRVPANTADQYLALLSLAHEISHAEAYLTGDTNYAMLDVSPSAPTIWCKWDDKVKEWNGSSSSMASFVKASLMSEGKAIYDQIIALHQIYKDKIKIGADGYKEFKRNFWAENAQYETKQHNFYSELVNIIYGKNADPTTAAPKAATPELIKELADINAMFTWGTLDNTIGSGRDDLLTYEEGFNLNWLLNNTDIALDYLAAVGYVNPAPNEPLNREKAIYIIAQNDSYHRDFKVLANSAHKGKNALNGNKATDYFGTNLGDALHAEWNGSILGNKWNKREVLWGGNGNDALHGGAAGDLLLGGEGDDRLYGNAGADTLAGGSGEDTYILDRHNGVRQGGDIITDPDGTGKIYIRNNTGQEILLEGHGKAAPELGAGFYRDVNQPNIAH